jgi:hypothetical protein
MVALGCGALGWKYEYRGQEYTMTQTSIEYHENAVRDVWERFGNLETERDIAKLEGACHLLGQYFANAPSPGSFTSVRSVLHTDLGRVCQRAERLKEEAVQHAQRAVAAREQEERERAYRERAERDRAAQQAALDRERAERERADLARVLMRDGSIVESCDSTREARDARKRHLEILASKPGDLVSSTCRPQRAVQTVRGECKDANGFVRSCTKQVVSDEVTGFTCPKSMDPEVVQLGLYRLGLLDEYPYPEDRAPLMRDAECDAARNRLLQAQERLEALSATAGGASAAVAE